MASDLGNDWCSEGDVWDEVSIHDICVLLALSQEVISSKTCLRATSLRL